MKIGLTYDLRSEYLAAGYTEEETAEFDREETVAAIENALWTMGYETERIGNARALVTNLAAGSRWDLVFNIAEGLHGLGREAQVPAILDLFDIPYTFSDPLVMSLALHKGMTKHVLRDAGVATGKFCIVETEEELAGIDFSPPYFVKPVAEGTGKGVSPNSIVHRTEDLPEACKRLLTAYCQPVLVEEFLPGREFTVGIMGTGTEAGVLGTIEVHLLSGAEPHVYSYLNKERCEELVEYRLVSAAKDPVVSKGEAVALSAWKILGCRDAGRIDIRCASDGQPRFMEVNPLAGIHPEHSDLPIICNRMNISYETLIGRIVKSAIARAKTEGKIGP